MYNTSLNYQTRTVSMIDEHKKATAIASQSSKMQPISVIHLKQLPQCKPAQSKILTNPP